MGGSESVGARSAERLGLIPEQKTLLVLEKSSSKSFLTSARSSLKGKSSHIVIIVSELTSMKIPSYGSLKIHMMTLVSERCDFSW